MPQRATKRESAPAETLDNLSLGYNGYTDPTLTNPKMWAAAANVFSGAFGFTQRCRFANVVPFTNGGIGPTGSPFTSLKYFATPTTSAYLLGDINGELWSFDTGNNYAATQRQSPYFPIGAGQFSSLFVGPWSREVLQNIVYEMNGQLKQSGRGANAATIESFGLDAPDASPQVVLSSGSSQTITNIQRTNSVVTVNLAGGLTVPGGNGIGFINVTITAGDSTFAGTFVVATGSGTSTLTWSQAGLNTGVLTPTGTVNVSITKAIGRSYAWAWENANKPHVSAPSPATQFVQYSAQNGIIQLIEPGTVTTNGTTTVTGTGTFFTQAWVGRSIWINTLSASLNNRIVSVQSATQLTTANSISAAVSQTFQIYDPSATHVRLYETGDGQATYLRTQRNAFVPSATSLIAAGLQFFDSGGSEPPAFPFTIEISQLNNLPPPIGKYLNEYQGVLVVFGVSGADQSFFYSNQTATTIGMQQESFAPLNQVTLPIANGKMNGMLEFPGSAVIWSDKQDMFRLTGLLTDNLVTTTTPAQQGATIARLPYNLGIANPFACDITPLGGIWVTPNAEIWLFTDRYAPRNIGRPVQDILSTIATANLGLIRVKYFHSTNRNWCVVAVPANGASFNNTLLVLDLDLLASNGSPSYFTFDMATNSPAWWVFQPGPLVTQGTPPVTTIHPRVDSLEVVYESGGQVRLLSGGVDLIQDVDYRGIAFGTEIQVPGAGNTLHAWGNDSAFMMKRPSFFRFNTNRDPSLLATDGWTFQAQGIDDDFYTFAQPLALSLIPGVNDCSTLGGNPNLTTGSPFRHSPSLFKVGGVNFVMGRRIRFQVNFPAGTGVDYQFRSVQIGFGPTPPR